VGMRNGNRRVMDVENQRCMEIHLLLDVDSCEYTTNCIS
jgi:hypothetical protein